MDMSKQPDKDCKVCNGTGAALHSPLYPVPCHKCTKRDCGKFTFIKQAEPKEPQTAEPKGSAS